MKKTILLTGSTGAMGLFALKELKKDLDKYKLRLFVQNSKKNQKFIEEESKIKGIEIYFGDLSIKEDVIKAVKDVDIILHIAAFVSPNADYYPKLAMSINYGGTKNLVDSVLELGQKDRTKFVYIGTVAETGDRLPPIHWGRIGDPIKPSVYDYYAVSKIVAERYVIESDLTYWVSLRQTGIIGTAMSKITDAIVYHNCLNNVLEYISDRDSGIMIRNLCNKDNDKTLPKEFWNHIYNIGGGESCRVDTYTLFQRVYNEIGITKLKYAISPKMIATRNFHGHYYLDSDVLNDYLDFRNDSMEYFYESYLKELGSLVKVSKFICKLPLGQRFMGFIIRNMFKKSANGDHGTIKFIKKNWIKHIAAYWGSKKAWDEIPVCLDEFKRFTDWDTVVHIDHGYDESKPQSEICLEDVKGAAEFRGGKCLSNEMKKGDWKTKLEFSCAFNHTFEASPKLVLEGGHWCPVCERESWNYGQRAKVDKFFAQVWNPLHPKDEEIITYKKEVTELDV